MSLEGQTKGTMLAMARYLSAALPRISNVGRSTSAETPAISPLRGGEEEPLIAKYQTTSLLSAEQILATLSAVYDSAH